MDELMTEKEKDRARRNDEIRADFKKLQREYPLAKKWRIYTHLSELYGLSVIMIRNIVLGKES